ncbi:branched-chain amino acid ABC transporter permease [Candidatus Acetothermia bacterium]|jgi:branched-chain amino acid transport system permease protein|nr:branched-chain amino acid ABC transporter permease [Candidatus Acetothermia bacterium]MCI2437465.1 branched-chain amino acid ABC transporter permease [Candidatus Acetothermia bacterium]
MLLLALLNGLVWGLLWALLALGLSLIYGTLGLLNLAHGAFYMLGALAGWALTPVLGFAGALVVAPLLVGALGFGSERLLLSSPRAHSNLTALLTTFALMLILQQLATISLQMTTGDLRHFVTPPFRWPIALGERFYEGYRLMVAGIAGAVLAGLWALLRVTTWGRWLRAARQNRELALSLGIPVPWVRAGAFGLGAALAALAGVLVGPIVREVQPVMGIEVLLVSVLIAVVGGLGNLAGAIAVAFLYSLTENLLTALTDPALARAGALMLIGMILLLRPRGLGVN